MANILLIETATATCSVAITDHSGEIIAIKERTEQNIHAKHITLFIEDVLKQAKLDIRAIDAVAVSKGPGSYTGLRIGVSTAKGICYALDKPLIAIDTLKAMASGLAEVYTNQLLCPMIDARRMEVFTAVFDTKLNQLEPTSALILDNGTFSQFYKKNELVLFGDGSTKCQNLYTDNPNISFNDSKNSARFMAGLAHEKFNNQDFENTAYFEPYYLKEFIAGLPKKSL